MRPATIGSFFEDDVPEKLAYKAQLTNMSTEKLTTLLADMNATEDAERKAWAKLQDQTKFFSKSRAQADHDSLSKMPYWDLDEATALSFDKDPGVVNWPNIGPHVNDSPFAAIVITNVYRSENGRQGLRRHHWSNPSAKDDYLFYPLTNARNFLTMWRPSCKWSCLF